MTGPYWKWLFFLILILLPIFIHLDRLPVRLWDEGRLGLNAYEMARGKSLLVTYFEGEPEMWNTKPPLMIWAQATCIAIFGLNELAIRLPAALAAFFSCLLLVWFSKKYFGSFQPGVLASLILVTCDGYIHIHASRTGDYDAPLTLFTTAYVLFCFLYLLQQKKRYLHLFFIALTLAILTKSVQAVLFLPAIFAYVFIRKKLALILKNQIFWQDAAIAVCVIGTYYVGREAVNPGYLQAVWENELGGRYFSTLEENRQPATYYLRLLTEFHFAYWSQTLPIVLLFIYWRGNKQNTQLSGYLLLLILSYTLIISLGSTKLEWYDVPLFPLLSLFVAIGVFQVIAYVQVYGTGWKKVAVPLLLIGLFAVPYEHILRKSYRPSEYPWDVADYPLSYVLQAAARGQLSLDGYLICYENDSQHLLFYIKALQMRGKQLQFQSVEKLKPGDRVIAVETKVIQQLKHRYSYTLLDSIKNVKFYRIDYIKQSLSQLTEQHSLPARNRP